MNPNNFLFLHGQRLNLNKNFEIQLNGIYGIGKTRAQKICKLYGIGKYAKVNTIKQTIADDMTNYIKKYHLVDKKLKETKEDKKTAIIKSAMKLRASRLILGYPANGQRTRSNAKTAKFLRHSAARIKKRYKKKI